MRRLPPPYSVFKSAFIWFRCYGSHVRVCLGVVIPLTCLPHYRLVCGEARRSMKAKRVWSNEHPSLPVLQPSTINPHCERQADGNREATQTYTQLLFDGNANNYNLSLSSQLESRHIANYHLSCSCQENLDLNELTMWKN